MLSFPVRNIDFCKSITASTLSSKLPPIYGIMVYDRFQKEKKKTLAQISTTSFVALLNDIYFTGSCWIRTNKLSRLCSPFSIKLP